ncbi:Amidase [Bradyrhizobium shewense]|uniref:Amidase n=1 Tax=Bradyrhizobium shewense TaxID=1761772 RepID=A0A1C3XU19_9BRAD|nr:Amidase [Bradyrhizobium shewense]
MKMSLHFRGLMKISIGAYNLIGRCPDELPLVKYPRPPGYPPSAEVNPRNAWYRKTKIQGATGGKLKGKTVALKDNILLAGVPMMNGSATLEGYVPDFDATIVARMLDAGQRSSEGLIASRSASSAVATPMQPARCTIYTRWAILLAALPREAELWSPSARLTWNWSRPRRFDPHAILVLRHLRYEADLGSPSLYGKHAYREFYRSHRTDDCAFQTMVITNSRPS